jgi:hypothetical protein
MEIKATDLFSTGPIQKIPLAQSKFVAEEMGINECLSPKEMNKLFWKYFHQNQYWLKAFLPYIFSSLFITAIFNGPWIKHIIAVRQRIIK